MATLAADTTSTATEERLAPASITNFGGIVVVGGALLLVIAAAIARATADAEGHTLSRFWHAYLLGASYAGSFSLGGLFFVIAHHLTGGRWGTSLRRIAEIVAGTMPYTAMLFVPVLLNVATGSHALYEWNHSLEYLKANDELLAFKEPYLNAGFFITRSIIYLAIFCGLAWLFVGGSVKQDKSGSVASLRRLSRLSGPGMVLFAVALNFAAFDWLMSLTPHWFSTIYGVIFFAGCFLAFLSLLMLLAIGLQSVGVLTQSITTDNRHDVAKLMYAFVVFWAYVTFSQFLLQWYPNIPEETQYYGGTESFAGWQNDEPTPLGIPFPFTVLMIVHLFIPFLGFMSSAVRRSKPAMIFWAAYMLVAHWIDLFLMTMTSVHGYAETPAFQMIGFYEIACTIGAVAVILGAVLRVAEDKWLLPVRDPRLKQATTYHNH